MRLNSPITALKGVGPQLAKRLARLQIETVQDLLLHLPFRYQDRTRLTPFSELAPEMEVVIEGRVQSTEIRQGRRRTLRCTLEDEAGNTIAFRLFHFAMPQKYALQPGTRVRCFGEIHATQNGLEMAHPEYQIFAASRSVPLLPDRLTPVYPASEGISSKKLVALTDQILEPMLKQLPELLAELPRNIQPDLSLAEALRTVHRPAPQDSQITLEHAHARIALEELLAHHLSLQKIRQQGQQQAAPPLNEKEANNLLHQFYDQLPFSLTHAQQRCVDEIIADLKRDFPMRRLLQGDVGSGKTAVAACAALQTIGSGMQVALMAPTELLAHQHLENFQRWLEPLGLRAELLASSLKAKEKRHVLDRLLLGNTQIAIGTHALFQQGVEFRELGLIIIDEQHRFGVDQRHQLQQKGHRVGLVPHQLIMTATPIPRTLSMTLYADLDQSILDEMPPGRTPVNTVILPQSRRDEIITRIHANCREGKQAYWVCPLIEESENLQCEAATETFEQLREQLPDMNIGLVHGQMHASEKEQIMEQFRNHDLDLLVATTVIEVGVDVPNASLMIIENAERLGLAQLHQIRGRVGRGDVAGNCVLLYKPPLSAASQERLKTIRDHHDGFKIAEKDLEMRGPGEILGQRQTGVLQFRVSDPVRDKFLFPQIEAIAQQMMQEPQLQPTVEQLIARWRPRGEEYASV